MGENNEWDFSHDQKVFLVHIERINFRDCSFLVESGIYGTLTIGSQWHEFINGILEGQRYLDRDYRHMTDQYETRKHQAQVKYLVKYLKCKEKRELKWKQMQSINMDQDLQPLGLKKKYLYWRNEMQKNVKITKLLH